MVKKSTGKGELQPRDDQLMTGLYHTTLKTTWQIARMYFPTAEARKKGTYEPSRESARRRLYDLMYMGWLVNWPYSRKEKLTLWMLSRRAFRREARNLKRNGEQYPDWPKEKLIRHYIETNELYVLLAGRLDEVLGEYPAWEWRNEDRSYREWSLRDRSGVHKPDAELRFADRVYFIERQTKRAREGAAYFDRRMAGYRAYCEYLSSAAGETADDNGSPLKPQVVWACDTERDMDCAFEAAKKHDVFTTVENPREACKYIVEEAKKL
jgi:hypothetical protein